MRWARIK